MQQEWSLADIIIVTIVGAAAIGFAVAVAVTLLGIAIAVLTGARYALGGLETRLPPTYGFIRSAISNVLFGALVVVCCFGVGLLVFLIVGAISATLR